jgi:hypothetical protein
MKIRSIECVHVDFPKIEYRSKQRKHSWWESDEVANPISKKDQFVDTLEEPSHRELCDLEQQMFLDAREHYQDFSESMQTAVNSLKIVLAAEESIQQGQADYF